MLNMNIYKFCLDLVCQNQSVFQVCRQRVKTKAYVVGFMSIAIVKPNNCILDTGQGRDEHVAPYREEPTRISPARHRSSFLHKEYSNVVGVF